MPTALSEKSSVANTHAGTALGSPAEHKLRSSDDALDPEWLLLLSACSIASPDEKRSRLLRILGGSVRWQRLFSLAQHHGVQPLLCQAISSVQEAVPPEQIQALQQAAQENLYKALLVSRELIHIVQRLSALDIEVLPYKGPALAELLYGDVALRQSGDIDLFIHVQDLARIRNVVRNLGYIQHEQFSAAEEHAYLKSGYEYAFDAAAGRNLLELKWAIQPRFYAVDYDIDGIFHRAISINVAGQPMKTASPADLFLILSVHAAKHVWDRLGWLCDIARLMTLPSLDWNWIVAEARKLGVVRILGVTILLANQMIDAPVPEAAHDLMKDNAASAVAEEIQNHVISESVFNTESLAYFRLMMRLRERPADRLRFLTRLAFTSGPGEWRTVRLPEPLFPLYSVVRLTRLAIRIVGA